MQKSIILGLVIIAALVSSLSIVSSQPAVFGATRSLSSSTYTPGTPLTVVIDINVGAQSICSSSITEQPPSGWTVSNVNGPGGGSVSFGKIVWTVDGPDSSCGSTPQNYSVNYTVTPPAGDSGTKTFSGRLDVIDYDTTQINSTTISGSTSLTYSSSPADNTGDIGVSGGSGGGGGGGAGGSTTSKCYTNWTCTAWSDCSNSVQTRSCSKENASCVNTTTEPTGSQSCLSNNPAGNGSGNNMVNGSGNNINNQSGGGQDNTSGNAQQFLSSFFNDPLHVMIGFTSASILIVVCIILFFARRNGKSEREEES